MYAGKYDSSTKLLSDITVQQFTDGQVTQIERAKLRIGTVNTGLCTMVLFMILMYLVKVLIEL